MRSGTLADGGSRGLNELGDGYYEALCSEYQGKRDLLCGTLSEVGLIPYTPKGSYYVLADVSTLPGKNSKEKAMYLLNKTGVASVPGQAFYHDVNGENLVRFCFAKRREVLEEACERLRHKL